MTQQAFFINVRIDYVMADHKFLDGHQSEDTGRKIFDQKRRIVELGYKYIPIGRFLVQWTYIMEHHIHN